MNKLISVVLAALAMAAQAQTAAPVVAYGSLQWGLATSDATLSACNRLVLDASGDFVSGSSFVLAGFLNCTSPQGRTAALGNGWFEPSSPGAPSRVVMRLRLPSGVQIYCPDLVSLSGICRLQTASMQDMGPIQLSFL